MNEDAPSPRPHSFLGWGIALAAAIAAFLHLWLTVRIGDLYFVPSFPVFRLGSGFFAEHADHAGGLTQYVAAFLYQLFYLPWAGALVVVAMAVLLSLAAGELASAVTGRTPLFLAALPGLLILLLANRYAYFLEPALALLLATGAAVLWMRVGRNRPAVRITALLGLAALLYYVGAGTCVCFASLCALGALLRGRFGGVAGAVAVGVAVPFVWATWLLPLRLDDAYLRLLPLHRSADSTAWPLAVSLYLSVPIVLLIVVLADRFSARTSGSEDVETAGKGGTRVRAAAFVVLIAGAGVMVLLSHDRYGAALMQIERGKRTGRWHDVVAVAEQMPRAWIDPVVSWDINLALHRRGQLLDRMFEFPQSTVRLMANTQIFNPPELQETVSLQFSDLMLETGLVNHAERNAYQAMELHGRRPWIVRRLVVTAVLRKQYEAAGILLGYLSGDLFYGRWARRQLAALRRSPDDWGGERIRTLSDRVCRKDRTRLPGYDVVMIEQLDENPRNRAAFDYLIAGYLVAGDLKSVVLRSDKLGPTGYERVPRHVDEALALYESGGRPGLPPDVHASAEAKASLREFASEMAGTVAGGGDPRAELRERFGSTYFYYYAFGPQAQR